MGDYGGFDLTTPIAALTGSELPVSEITKADPRNLEILGLTIEGLQASLFQYERLLSANIPDEVRERLRVARWLATHGWFRWEFYTVSLSWSLTAIEMGLRTRLIGDSPHRRRGGLRALLGRARETGTLLEDTPVVMQELRSGFHHRFFAEVFPTWARQRGLLISADPTAGEVEIAWAALTPSDRAELQHTPLDILVDQLPRFRNHFAHPNFLNLMLIPRACIEGLGQAVEILNRLWPPRGADGNGPAG